MVEDGSGVKATTLRSDEATLGDNVEREHMDQSTRNFAHHRIDGGRTHMQRAKPDGRTLRGRQAREVEEAAGMGYRDSQMAWKRNGGLARLTTSGGSTEMGAGGEVDKAGNAQRVEEPSWTANNTGTKLRKGSASSENALGHTKGPLCQILALSDDYSLLHSSPRTGWVKEREVEERMTCRLARRRTMARAATELGRDQREHILDQHPMFCGDSWRDDGRREPIGRWGVTGEGGPSDRRQEAQQALIGSKERLADEERMAAPPRNPGTGLGGCSATCAPGFVGNDGDGEEGE
ncbi:hypothetical protein LXA43DRAFT_1064066 [Ganoderma leucocontextum]|nr:hypothetical protein LXA43DRAFT_1064066 [Ganoderma leucocontextum]